MFVISARRCRAVQQAKRLFQFLDPPAEPRLRNVKCFGGHMEPSFFDDSDKRLQIFQDEINA
ncbi:hypothetical protein D8I24_2706 (plasmid) [Cupriavidus necator H850]|nr:hypothetical protein D8I24_2706 [Cupriavidus necator H850]